MTLEKGNNTIDFNDTEPFEGLQISDKWRLLETLDERSICSKCKRSRKYFCYSCYIPVDELQGHVPNITLPLKIDVIKHAKEIDGKSTAIHAAVLAPGDVSIYTYPCIPDYPQDGEVVLIYPAKDAESVNEFLEGLKCENQMMDEKDGDEPATKRRHSVKRCKLKRAIFIDATWNQSKGIYKDPRLKNLPCVVLQSRISQFWRHQKGSPRWYLATIEAIHQFLVEFHAVGLKTEERTQDENNVNNNKESAANDSNALGGDANRNSRDPVSNYKGEYDNLLFFFRFMYHKIHTLYNHSSLLSYKRPLN